MIFMYVILTTDMEILDSQRNFVICKNKIINTYLQKNDVDIFYHFTATMTGRMDNRYETPSPQPIVFDIVSSSLDNDIRFFSAPKPRRQSKPGDIGWGIALAENSWFRQNPNAAQVLLLNRIST